VAGKVIDAGNRAFQVEIHIPNDKDIRANQVAVVKLQDYTASNVLTIRSIPCRPMRKENMLW